MTRKPLASADADHGYAPASLARMMRFPAGAIRRRIAPIRMKGLVRKNLENNAMKGRRLHYSCSAAASFACSSQAKSCTWLCTLVSNMVRD